MRVLLTTHLFPPDGITGVERYTKTLALELVKAGDTVSIVSRRPEAKTPNAYLQRERLQHGIRLYRVVGGEAAWNNCLAHYRRLEQLFKLILVESRAEVVHFNQMANFSPRSVEIAQRLGAAVIHGIHDFHFSCPLIHLLKPSGEICQGPDGGRECARSCFAREGEQAKLRWGLRTMYFRRLLEIGEYIICPSRFVAAHFEAFGAPLERIRVIPDGLWIENIDAGAELPRLPSERGALNLAFLGAVVFHKGVHAIIEALRIANLPSVNLYIHGPQPEPDYAGKLRDRARLLPGVKLHWQGAYYPHDLPDLLRDIDCVITPSQVPETYSFVAREALVRGVPVIVSRMGGLPESVVEGQNGFTFAVDRPGDLATLIRRLATEEGLLPRLRAGARSSRFMSVAEHALAVRELYHKALEERPRLRPLEEGDRSELDFLQEALIDLGFAGATQVASAGRTSEDRDVKSA